MPAGVPEGVVRIRHRAGLEGEVGSVGPVFASSESEDSEGGEGDGLEQLGLGRLDAVELVLVVRQLADQLQDRRDILRLSVLPVVERPRQELGGSIGARPSRRACRTVGALEVMVGLAGMRMQKPSLKSRNPLK